MHPDDVFLNRDTRILNGELSLKERAEIDKRWARAIRLGTKIVDIKERRERKAQRKSNEKTK